jgi:hypothetical protein
MEVRMPGSGRYAELLADPVVQAIGEGELVKERKIRAPAEMPGLFYKQRTQDGHVSRLCNQMTPAVS